MGIPELSNARDLPRPIETQKRPNRDLIKMSTPELFNAEVAGDEQTVHDVAAVCISMD